MSKILLSGIVIAKNSEELLPDCLKSLPFCDEIIVVDGGSTDKTVVLAQKMGARVIQGTAGDFAKQRNEGLNAAKGKWVLYIDTDERVSTHLQKSIMQAVKQETKAAYFIQRQNFYLGNHPWPHVEKLERLFQKNRLEKWIGRLHESPVVAGEVGVLEGLLFHYTHRDLASMLDKTIQWSGMEAQLRLDAHHPLMTWWRFPRVMVTGFLTSYWKQGGWKAGTAGLIESLYQSYSMFITYARLWELQQK